MRYFIITMAISMFMVGCQKPAEPMPQIGQPIETKPEEKPVQPVAPKPVAPNQTFLKGYSDGYYGNWLAPAQFALNPDYRAGRGEGASDREKGLPFRYQH
jgi:hypothetical protein